MSSAPQQQTTTPVRIISLPAQVAPAPAAPLPPPPPAERRIDIQPAEDEGDAADESLSVKHVARARYMRNQFLADKLFGRGGGDGVPDTRQGCESIENKTFELRLGHNFISNFEKSLNPTVYHLNI